MHIRMLKPRAGFTLVEMLVALTLTAVLGATITGAFVSQSRFFDRQEKVGAARSVARAGTSMLLSDLRMLEGTQGIVSASASSITVNVPYALGLACSFNSGKLRISRLPVDSLVLASAAYSGWAYRNGNSGYIYPTPAGPPTNVGGTCPPITVIADGQVMEIPGAVSVPAGTPVLLYQTITYAFKASTSVSGRLGLFRKYEDGVTLPIEEEIAAPFGPGAGFRFFVDHTGVAQTAVPSPLNSITGVEIALDGLSERPNSDGTHESVSHTTAVFFKNR